MSVKAESNTDQKWYLVDATGMSVGRLAGAVAQILRGKHKPTFAYNQDVGDHVIVINAAMLGLVAALLGGFAISSFWTAVGASLIVSVTSWVASGLIGNNGRIEVIKGK